MSPRQRARRPAPAGDALIACADVRYAHAILRPHFDSAFATRCVANVASARTALSSLDDLRLVLIDVALDPELAFAREIRDGVPDAVVAALTRRGDPRLINAAHRLGVAYLHRERCAANLEALARLASAISLPTTSQLSPRAFLATIANVDEMTPRQRHVARLLLHGLARDEIASRLGIAEVTVKSHIRDVLRACRVATTTALLRGYLRALHARDPHRHVSASSPP